MLGYSVLRNFISNEKSRPMRTRLYVASPLLCKLSAIALVALSFTSARANTVWNWSFGTEAGQFVMAGSSFAPGTYTLVDFSVTSSGAGATIGSLSGGQYSTGHFSTSQPFTFDWNGVSVTAWYHSGINTFNWWAFEDLPGPGSVFFGWGLNNVNIVNSGAYYTGNNSSVPALGTISVVPGTTSVPDTGSTVALFVTAIVALGFLKRTDSRSFVLPPNPCPSNQGNLT